MNNTDNTRHFLDLLESQAQKGAGLELLSKLKHKETQEKTRSRLAYWVLGAIFATLIITVICAFFSAAGYIQNEFTTMLFEVWRTGLLPIVTLILGYYFSKE